MGHHGRTVFDKVHQNPIQSQGLLTKMTVFHEIMTKMTTFRDVRFVGDILAKTAKFHVFQWFSVIFSKFCTFPLGNLRCPKQWKLAINQWCPKKCPKNGDFLQKRQKRAFWQKLWGFSRDFWQNWQFWQVQNVVSKSGSFDQIGILGLWLYRKEAWWTTPGPCDTAETVLAGHAASTEPVCRVVGYPG